ncbi:MAG: hypothetical protein ABFE08_17095 [Armatimonadia bacterium]
MRFLWIGLMLMAITLPALAQQSPWPPREYLLKSLVDGIEPILKSQDPATGRFGTQPWICLDQNVLLPLAAAWAIEDKANPWYHSDRVLTAIAKGGEALVDDQDANGMWTFRKKDNSTWGQIHMPWTYSRWIRAYVLVKDALPPESRAKWDKGLLLGFTGIRRYADGGVHNIPTHHAMALYIAGVAFNNDDWKQAAQKFMAKVVEKQDPAGFWSENFGPVIGYNEVYVDALGVYYSFSKDPVVLTALQRSARFHSAVLWPDGSSLACIDERQVYHPGIETGTVGFTWTPEGRGYLQQQMGLYMATRPTTGSDYAANMLLYGGTGEAIKPAAAGDKAVAYIGDRNAVIVRDKPWQWAFSAYACPVPKNRWVQDRHNLVDIYCDGLGVVAGGGNTKLQPYWSTFTVGDPELLKHTPGDENPNFAPEIDLLWTPTSAELSGEGSQQTLKLKYGETACSVSCEPLKDGALRVTYEAPADKRVEAHLPLYKRGGRIRTATGQNLRLTEESLVLTSAQVGDWFVYAGLRVTMPAGARLLWPMFQHDPYKKDGSSGLGAAKLVLAMPFTGGKNRQEVTLSRPPQEQFPGRVFEARDMKCTVTGDGYTKRLDDLGSQLLGTRQPGAALSFTLPGLKAGKYELLAEFVMASMYGTAQISVDGKAVGEVFDAYGPDVDTEGDRISFGTVDLTAGDHVVTMQMTGKNAKSTGYLLSVKRWLLRPVK